MGSDRSRASTPVQAWPAPSRCSCPPPGPLRRGRPPPPRLPTLRARATGHALDRGRIVAREAARHAEGSIRGRPPAGEARVPGPRGSPRADVAPATGSRRTRIAVSAPKAVHDLRRHQRRGRRSGARAARPVGRGQLDACRPVDERPRADLQPARGTQLLSVPTWSLFGLLPRRERLRPAHPVGRTPRSLDRRAPLVHAGRHRHRRELLPERRGVGDDATQPAPGGCSATSTRPTRPIPTSPASRRSRTTRASPARPTRSCSRPTSGRPTSTHSSARASSCSAGRTSSRASTRLPCSGRSPIARCGRSGRPSSSPPPRTSTWWPPTTTPATPCGASSRGRARRPRRGRT